MVRFASPRKCVSEVWLSLITIWKGTALKIVQSTDLPSAAWLQRYRACGVKDKTRLMREFHSLKMELGEDPQNIPHEGVSRRQGCRKPSTRTTKNLEFLNRLTEEYAIKRRMLDGGDDEPTRAHIEKAILTQYDRLRAERSEEGAKALGVAATPGNHKSQSAPSKSKWGKQRLTFDGE